LVGILVAAWRVLLLLIRSRTRLLLLLLLLLSLWLLLLLSFRWWLLGRWLLGGRLLSWLLLSWLRARLLLLGGGHGLLLSGCELVLLVFHHIFKEVVGSELLVLVAGEVGFCSLVLGESELYKTINSIHFFLSDLDGPWGSLASASAHSASHASASAHTTAAEAGVGVASEDQVHEGAWVLLDGCENLWLTLLKLLHKLLIE